MKNRQAITKLLLESGANPDIQDKDGWTPLHMAAWHNASRTTSLLSTHGANVNVRNKQGQTPLHIAADYHAAEVAAILLLKADPHIRDNNGCTALHLACASWDDRITGHDITIRHSADPTVVRLLLNSGARPDVIDEAKRTPLDVACMEGGGDEIVEMLAVAWTVHTSHLMFGQLITTSTTARRTAG